jgi:hypothetical protein
MSYLGHFGGERTVIVKINPADVVSIPSDYNDAKGRACRYEVIGELNVEASDAFTAPVQSNAHGTYTVRARVEPKVNYGPFSKGYTDGYTGESYANVYNYGSKEHKAYDSGFEAGQEDREDGSPERYRFAPKSAPSLPKSAVWPFPTKG